jgi:TetR/AcrR family transcriptional regulator of autoinduction and epiphytic fitness
MKKPDLKKRKAILDATIEEFYQNGYEKTSMETISRKAGVSKATLYNHFKSKEDLFFTITADLQEKIESCFNFKYSSEIAIEEQFREIIQSELDFLSDEVVIILIKIVTVVILQNREIAEKLDKEVKEKSLIKLTEWFIEAKADGKVKVDDPNFASQQLIGSVKSFAFYPQLYGASTLSESEKSQLLQNTVQMALKLYT